MRARVSHFLFALIAFILLSALGACDGETSSAPSLDGDDIQTDGDSPEAELSESETTPPEDGDSESTAEGEAADSDMDEPPVDGDADSITPDGDSEAEAEDCLQTRFTSPTDPSLLAVGQTINLDATQPGWETGLLSFRYTLLAAPPMARSLRLVCATCDPRFGENLLQSTLFGPDAKTRFYAPVAGRYIIGVDVQGPDNFCHAQISFDLYYTEDLAIELVEEELDYPQSNVDLLLVRERANATFAVPAAADDLYHPSPVAMPGCSKDAECYGGLFPCDTTLNICKNQCASTTACQAIDLGYVCQDQVCQPLASLSCTQDKDCSLGLSCMPLVMDDKAQSACTLHDGNAQNDTCFPKNPTPVWGAYQPTETRCQETRDCLLQDTKRVSLCNAAPENTNTCAVPIPAEQPTITNGGPRFPEVQRILLGKAPQSRLRGVVHQRKRGGSTLTKVWLMVYAKGLPLWLEPLTTTFGTLDEIVWKAFDFTLGASPSLRTLCAGRTDVSCESDGECQERLGNSAFRCESGRCSCPGSNPNGLFASDPYANPFSLSAKGEGLPFVPQSATPRSIFCDLPTDQPAPDGPTCATIYNR